MTRWRTIGKPYALRPAALSCNLEQDDVAAFIPFLAPVSQHVSDMWRRRDWTLLRQLRLTPRRGNLCVMRG